MKICDLTQFYSPRSGGVKRYLHEKIAFLETQSPDHRHVLIVPGAKTSVVVNGRSTVYTIHSPLIPRSGGYRALLNLAAIDEVIERERPDVIECADPYQLAWKTLRASRNFRIPAVAFYHSHFPEAYFRAPARRLGRVPVEIVMRGARAYVCNLYNRFERTLCPSAPLAKILREWGVRGVDVVNLGVNTAMFCPPNRASARSGDRATLPADRIILLYVGRLASEKNTKTLFQSFRLVAQHTSKKFHLVVVGDGPERGELQTLKSESEDVTWLPYCADPSELTEWYRVADIFVHPGVQETFGLVALESQACGTPVLGIRGSRMDEIIFHNQESWAKENTAEALAQAILQMSERDLTGMSEIASATARESYSWPRVFDRLLCIYRDVCAHYQPS